MKIINIGLSGAYGKMGKAIEELLADNTNFNLMSKLSSSSSITQIEEACHSCDIIIDFSNSSSIIPLTKSAYKYDTKLVVGTTGLSPEHMDNLNQLAQKTAVIYAPNTSIGANLVAEFAAQAAIIMKDYDAEIIEAHHRYKKDAPSGTALMIGKKIAQARGIDFDKNKVFDRSSKGVRQYNEIGFSSIRGGGIFGENEVIFAGDNEMISIEYRAFSRDAFAKGALVAASWVFDKNPGLYSMKDVLGL